MFPSAQETTSKSRHSFAFLRSQGDTWRIARSLGLMPINAPVCRAQEQRHGRELRQHLPARLREQDGPYRRADSARPALGTLRTLQGGSSPLENADEITARVQAASG